MGNSSSKLERALAECPDDERYYGLENFGNTCYCNSVLQALYFCRPFREKVLQFGQSLPRDEDNLLNCLVELFLQVRWTQNRCFCASAAPHRLPDAVIKRWVHQLPPAAAACTLRRHHPVRC
jgi:uncharacterized UBP type Zn finger protein